MSVVVSRVADTTLLKRKKAARVSRLPQENLGTDLLSHARWNAVPSALAGLTSGFGMGPGVTPPLWAPRNRCF